MQSFQWPPLGEMLASVVQWRFNWTSRVVACQAAALRQLYVVVQRPSPSSIDRLVANLRDCGASATSAPFDMARSGYAAGVQCGLIERSLLGSAAFDRQLASIEQQVCWPYARTV